MGNWKKLSYMIDVDMIKREIEYYVDELAGKRRWNFHWILFAYFENTSCNFVSEAIDIRYQVRNCEIFAQKTI